MDSIYDALVQDDFAELDATYAAAPTNYAAAPTNYAAAPTSYTASPTYAATPTYAAGPRHNAHLVEGRLTGSHTPASPSRTSPYRSTAATARSA